MVSGAPHFLKINLVTSPPGCIREALRSPQGTSLSLTLLYFRGVMIKGIGLIKYGLQLSAEVGQELGVGLCLAQALQDPLGGLSEVD